MSTFAIHLDIDDSATQADLQAKRGTLMAAIEETMGTLGEELWGLARGKIAPVIRTEIGQGIFDSIQLAAAAFVDQVCSTSVFIEPSGQPSYIVAYVREFGGEKWYDIYPLETSLGFVSDAGIGPGIKSPHSSKDQEAWQESRLPHALAWAEGGGTVFARHVWHPPAKEQSYLRSSLAEIEQQAYTALTVALNGVLAS
jgi:hypothetical protein